MNVKQNILMIVAVIGICLSCGQVTYAAAIPAATSGAGTVVTPPANPITVTGTYNVEDYPEDTVIQITPVDGDQEITLTGNNGVQIKCTIGDVHLILDGLTIENDEHKEGALAFTGIDNRLTLKSGSNNDLKSGGYMAGVEVEAGTELTIDGDGSLNVKSGLGGAAIGGAYDRDNERGHDAGRITISDGVIKAIGYRGAGIGGGGFQNFTTVGGSVESIRITGNAVVEASSEEGSAAIGGGASYISGKTARGGSCGEILIDGNAKVTAISEYTTAIGNGRNNLSGGEKATSSGEIRIVGNAEVIVKVISGVGIGGNVYHPVENIYIGEHSKVTVEGEGSGIGNYLTQPGEDIVANITIGGHAQVFSNVKDSMSTANDIFLTLLPEYTGVLTLEGEDAYVFLKNGGKPSSERLAINSAYTFEEISITEGKAIEIEMPSSWTGTTYAYYVKPTTLPNPITVTGTYNVEDYPEDTVIQIDPIDGEQEITLSGKRNVQLKALKAETHLILDGLHIEYGMGSSGKEGALSFIGNGNKLTLKEGSENFLSSGQTKLP